MNQSINYILLIYTENVEKQNLKLMFIFIVNIEHSEQLLRLKFLGKPLTPTSSSILNDNKTQTSIP